MCSVSVTEQHVDVSSHEQLCVLRVRENARECERERVRESASA